MAKEELSKSLHEVLDFIGVSEYYRKEYWEFGMVNEIPITFDSHLYDEQQIKTSQYIFGSACEGTTSSGLKSDVDILQCKDDCLVVDDLVKSKPQGVSLLILTEENTKPRYVHLQLIKGICPLFNENSYQKVKLGLAPEENRFELNQKGKLCYKPPKRIFGRITFPNGPAETIPELNGCCKTDLVYALRCRQIPKSANSWLHRKRQYDWPSQRHLKTMGSYGCFLVGVAHPNSEHKSIEWRISFSLQERELMSSLNETQHKCYVLLKMIKQDIVEPKVGESISSYHCKTSLFHTIETSHSRIWTKDNLIHCTWEGLKRLFIWVKAKNCPNYFIPEENLFDKIGLMTLNNLEQILNEMIDGGVSPLYSLTCDNVGELLKAKMCGSELVCNTRHEYKLMVYKRTAASIYLARNIFLRRLNSLYKTLTCFLNGTL